MEKVTQLKQKMNQTKLEHFYDESGQGEEAIRSEVLTRDFNNYCKKGWGRNVKEQAMKLPSIS
jgi:hypothetical protein